MVTTSDKSIPYTIYFEVLSLFYFFRLSNTLIGGNATQNLYFYVLELQALAHCARGRVLTRDAGEQIFHYQT